MESPPNHQQIETRIAPRDFWEGNIVYGQTTIRKLMIATLGINLLLGAATGCARISSANERTPVTAQTSGYKAADQ